MLPDGRRLHLQHGPIDLIVEAWGAHEDVAASYRLAVDRFETVLTQLVGELPLLREAVDATCRLQGTTARRMWRATACHLPRFVTPMAAVAGAVADEVLTAMTRGRNLRRAYVNNGGDIALYLSAGDGNGFRVGLVVDPDDPRMPGAIEITADMPVRGIATSGRHGRSLSLGIADSVTVLAADAAAADAAATLVANAVDLPGHPAVRREPANTLDPDSDLGARLVTTCVGPLSADEIDAALAAGVNAADDMIGDGLLHAAVLVLGPSVRLVGDIGAQAPQRHKKENRVHA
jgi:uncharacterized protein